MKNIITLREELSKNISDLNQIYDYYSTQRTRNSKLLMPLAKRFNVNPNFLKQTTPVWINHMMVMRDVLDHIIFRLVDSDLPNNSKKETNIWHNKIVSSFNAALRTSPPIDKISKIKDDFPKICYVSTSFPEIFDGRLGRLRIKQSEDKMLGMSQLAGADDRPVHPGVVSGVNEVYSKIMELANNEANFYLASKNKK